MLVNKNSLITGNRKISESHQQTTTQCQSASQTKM
jgi:hypothetical protein